MSILEILLSIFAAIFAFIAYTFHRELNTLRARYERQLQDEKERSRIRSIEHIKLVAEVRKQDRVITECSRALLQAESFKQRVCCALWGPAPFDPQIRETKDVIAAIVAIQGDTREIAHRFAEWMVANVCGEVVTEESAKQWAEEAYTALRP
jgi:hypothetical protein